MSGISNKEIIKMLVLLELSIDEPYNSQDVINNFRKISKIYHPDVANERYKDGNKFKELLEAKEYLVANESYINNLIRSGFNNSSKPNTYDDYVFRRQYDEKKRQEEENKRKSYEEEQKRREKEDIYNTCYKRANDLIIIEDKDIKSANRILDNIKTIHPYKDTQSLIDLLLRKIKDYDDKKKKEEEIRQEQERISKLETIYLTASNLLEIEVTKANKNEFKTSIELMVDLNYKDSREIYYKLKQKIDEYLEKEKIAFIVLKKKIIKLSSIILTFIALIIIAITIIVNVIVPKIKYNNAIQDIEQGNYTDAENILVGMNFKDSNKLYTLLLSRKEFEKGDYEKGIDYVYNIGGTINVDYEGNGGKTNKDSEIIKLNRYIDNDTTKDNYDFTKWELYDYKINFKNYVVDVYLKALYKPHSYSITYDLDGGQNNLSNIFDYNVEMSDISLYEPYKKGYTFVGWKYNDKFISGIDTSNGCDITLKANWTFYTLTTKSSNSYAGNISEYTNEKITVGEEVCISAEINPGYSFDGWYNGNIKLTNSTSYTFKMPAQNITYEAKFIPKKYHITIDNNVDNLSISGIISDEDYECGSTITLVANNIPSGCAIGWNRSDNQVSFGSTYTFTVPPQNIDISVDIVYVEENNYVYFGSYPQKKVDSLDVIDRLNELAGSLPTSNDFSTWNDYSYYIKTNVESYMFYKDIDVDSDGDYDYRGVYFTKNRAYSITSDEYDYYSPQSTNGYNINTVYWFEYSPIKWRIQKKENNRALLIAELIIDAQEYYSETNGSTYGKKFEHNGGIGYASNYELSNIREWLNYSFYDAVFDNLQKNIINEIIVNNYVDKVSVDYGRDYFDVKCNDTYDKIFLLSRDEVHNGIYSRSTTATDYALCQGAYKDVNGYFEWWSRTPSGINSSLVIDSNIFYGTEVTRILGIRPACWIQLC